MLQYYMFVQLSFQHVQYQCWYFYHAIFFFFNYFFFYNEHFMKSRNVGFQQLRANIKKLERKKTERGGNNDHYIPCTIQPHQRRAYCNTYFSAYSATKSNDLKGLLIQDPSQIYYMVLSEDRAPPTRYNRDTSANKLYNLLPRQYRNVAYTYFLLQCVAQIRGYIIVISLLGVSCTLVSARLRPTPMCKMTTPPPPSPLPQGGI